MKPCFVIGCESTRDYPGDTPEAYWRVLLPARHFKAPAAVLGAGDLEQTLRSADALWIYEPTSPSAVRLAEFARRLDKPVVCDWGEDIWRRGEQDRDYHQSRLRAATETMALADLIVVANPLLEGAYADHGATAVLETVFPLTGWTRSTPGDIPTIGWWSDGRQKAGSELVAPAVRRQMARGVHVWHVQFSHHAPLVAGLDAKQSRQEAGKLGAFFADDISKSADAVVRYYRDRLAPCLLSLECYAPGAYAESANDIPLLRAAAIGIPSLTTREHVPPGCVGATPDDWPDTLERLMTDQAWRESLAADGLRWVGTRSSFSGYEAAMAAIAAL
jgi:hypothetical protein